MEKIVSKNYCIGGVFVGSVGSYVKCYGLDFTSELKEIVNFLDKNDYKNGYATFWNANVLTELSNGSIEVWDWSNVESRDIESVNQTYHWAQKKSHDNEHPEGKVFWLVTREGNDVFSITGKAGGKYIIYESNKYIMYGFNDYDEMIFAVSDYTINFGDNTFLENGNDVEGMRYIHPGGFSWGPDGVLYPGEYRISCTGSGLDRVKCESVYYNDDERFVLGCLNLQQSDDFLSYEVDVEEEIRGYFPRFDNISNEDICMDKVTIEKIK